MDDQFPCASINSGLAFSRAKGPELWVLLLEKAYAKMYGSYFTIEGGDPAIALRDLTGAPVAYLDNCEDNLKLWDFIYGAEQKSKHRPRPRPKLSLASHPLEWIITCYTKSTNVREEQKEIGIVSGHAYSILDAREVNTILGKERLLQIRNPWGKFEWKGDWGDSSDKWTDELKLALGWVHADDGCFWMCLEDFKLYYEGVDHSTIFF